MAVALGVLVPRIVNVSFDVHPFQGKPDLISKLPDRLRAYRAWIPADWRVVVIVDEDRTDCNTLKQQLETAAHAAGFATPTTSGGGRIEVLNRIAVEELEAWFFGDVEAIRLSFAGVPASLGNRAAFRDPDAITGGTWEALQRVLRDAGHYRRGGMPKIEVARRIAREMDPDVNRSRSFRVFRDGLVTLVAAA